MFGVKYSKVGSVIIFRLSSLYPGLELAFCISQNESPQNMVNILSANLDSSKQNIPVETLLICLGD